MIVVRSPLRISLGGGGTDLPSYYQDHGGFLIAAAIDKYVYITLHQTFAEEIIVKYSKLERVDAIDKIEHPIVREVLKNSLLPSTRLEIASMADIPAGTGLGSSGSFTTALIKAIHTLQKNPLHPRELAEKACHIEINLLREPIGKQDQYIAAYGGINAFHFLPDHRVEIVPLKLPQETLYNLEDNLMLFFTGYSRAASSILQEQDKKSQEKETAMIENLHFIKELGIKSQAALEKNNLNEFAELMNVHWEHKKRRSTKMSNEEIDHWYQIARENGAVGGKMIGAGGGGFLMFYAEDKVKLRNAMKKIALPEVRFRFDFMGTQVITQ